MTSYKLLPAIAIALFVLLSCTNSSLKEISTSKDLFVAEGASNYLSENSEINPILTYTKLGSPPNSIDSNIYLYPICDKESDLNGYIDIDGEWVIPPIYTEAGYFKSGVALVKDTNNINILINVQNKILMELTNEIDFWIYSDEVLLGSYSKNHLGYIYFNWKGQLISKQFYEASPFSEGLAYVRESSQDSVGFISKDMEWAITPQYEDADCFSQGLAAAKKDGKYGYINTSGRWVIEPQYDSASAFCLGFASVEVDKQWGIIDKQGAFIIKPSFGKIVLTEDGVAHGAISAHQSFVLLGGMGTNFSVGIIDLQGNWVTEPIYGGDIIFNDGVGIAPIGISKEMIGLDYKGNTIIEPRYQLFYRGGGVLDFYRDSSYDSWATEYDNDFTSKANFEFGLMDSNGNIIYQQYGFSRIGV